jgi:hypothetical protein
MILEEKLSMLDKLEFGESLASVRQHFYISESSVNDIKQSVIRANVDEACGRVQS